MLVNIIESPNQVIWITSLTGYGTTQHPISEVCIELYDHRDRPSGTRSRHLRVNSRHSDRATTHHLRFEPETGWCDPRHSHAGE
ncbi:hypothetical protein ACFVUS_27110 [Nocardia sp. NPDC058058]|uniref:hypothetical protein n=1 Tax=Nocardia sp. NPDC058058 TaxID=3346317 RepID=UPI0036DF7F2E